MGDLGRSSHLRLSFLPGHPACPLLQFILRQSKQDPGGGFLLQLATLWELDLQYGQYLSDGSHLRVPILANLFSRSAIFFLSSSFVVVFSAPTDLTWLLVDAWAVARS